jgi:outer membrane protein, multidrug efflux system
MKRTTRVGCPEQRTRNRSPLCAPGTVLWYMVALLFGLGFCQGCAVGPDYVPPEMAMPDAWHQELAAGLAEGEADFQTWWTTLNDPTLNSLIDRAAGGNLTLKEAAARIAEARAQLGYAKGEFFPDVDASGSYLRSRESKEVTRTMPAWLNRTENYNSTGLDATWELDFWGRIRRSVASADAGMQASVEDYRDVLVVLYAEVALSYVEVRSLQTRIRLAHENLDRQRDTLRLTRDRLEAELVPELDVHQAELNLAMTESTIPQLRSRLVRTVNRLGVLLGEHPGGLTAELSKAAEIPVPPEQVTVGLPANLLRRRPDIRRSERLLASQTAQIGVATADLYPRFTLSGTFALEATSIDRSFRSGAIAYGFGPSFRWNIFDGGRVRNSIRVEEARTEQALARYERAVLVALEDVENAMAVYANEVDRSKSLLRAVTAAQKSVEQVQTLYRTGLTDFQNVLDMQRALVAQQDQLAQSRGLVIQNLVRLYKSLGGGWSAEAVESADQGDN